MAILQKEIDKLKESILYVGTLVEENFLGAIESINNNDIDSAQEVIKKDKEIDLKEIEVEEECLKILALHQPVAIDLRFIIAVLKINNDLERIGDLSCNIAKRTIALSKLPSIIIPNEILEMAKIVQQMIKESLDSLVELDITLAQKVCADDDKVD
nr:phosphate signaling complex protein PhoU [Candidatus Neomarinimicrobiota bacterium]